MMRYILAVLMVVSTFFIAQSPAEAVKRNAVYVMSDSVYSVPIYCANHKRHLLRPGHKSKCLRTIAFDARDHKPYTAYDNDRGNWQILKGGTYSVGNGRLLLRSGFTV